MLFSRSITSTLRASSSRAFSTSLPALAVYPTVYVSQIPKTPTAFEALQSRMTSYGLRYYESRLLPSAGTAKTLSAVFEVASEDEERMSDVYDVERRHVEEKAEGEIKIYLNHLSETSALEPDDSQFDIVNLPDVVPDRRMLLDLLGFRLDVVPQRASYQFSEQEGVLSGRGTVVPRGEHMVERLKSKNKEMVEGNELLVMRSPKEKANWIV